MRNANFFDKMPFIIVQMQINLFLGNNKPGQLLKANCICAEKS